MYCCSTLIGFVKVSCTYSSTRAWFGQTVMSTLLDCSVYYILKHWKQEMNDDIISMAQWENPCYTCFVQCQNSKKHPNCSSIYTATEFT